jgi:hypothetical protein
MAVKSFITWVQLDGLQVPGKRHHAMTWNLPLKPEQVDSMQKSGVSVKDNKSLN